MRTSNRRKILDAIIAIVERDGITAVTFDAVAAETGLTRGGLLYHFPSREALILAAHQHLADQWEAGMEKIAGAMESLRDNPPKAFAGTAIVTAEDYLARRCERSDGTVCEIALPKSDTLRWLLSDESWIVIRPSGTEPKLKLYIGARAKTKEQLSATLAALMQDVDGLLKGYLG